MATRDNQTMQIIVLVFVFISVIGIGSSIWFYSQAKASRAEVIRLQEEESTRRNAFNTLQKEAEQYRLMMGFKEEDNLQTVSTAYDEHMKKFGETFAEENRNYGDIVEHVATENQQLSAREQEVRKDFNELSQKFLALEAETKSRIKEFEQKTVAANETLATERQAFKETEAKWVAAREELAAAAQKLEQGSQEQLAAKDAEIKSLQDQLRDNKIMISQLQAGREQDHTVFERADGRITWVNQGTGSVWLNLGYADMLRPQISFSVYDETSPVAGQNEPKATIEVTRVIEDHLAEARISQDDPLNPIVPGDQIYSPVWEQGKQVRFALTGFIDIDGDGRDDSERARRLITSNGGVVDAYVNEEGDRVGEMTVNTRFLIEGGEPTGGRNGDLLKKQSDARQVMIKEAETKGVDLLSVDKFLSFVGWHPEERVVTLGSGASGDDFPPEPNRGSRGVSTGTNYDSSTETFRKRYPSTPY